MSETPTTAAPKPKKRRAPTKKKAVKKTARKALDGYKGHRKGSRKGVVHEVFDKKGRDAALKKAEALKISPNTARTWCQHFKAA